MAITSVVNYVMFVDHILIVSLRKKSLLSMLCLVIRNMQPLNVPDVIVRLSVFLQARTCQSSLTYLSIRNFNLSELLSS